MALISLAKAATYVRVDSADEDAMIGILLASACKLYADEARFTEEKWAPVDLDEESSDLYEKKESVHIWEIMRCKRSM